MTPRPLQPASPPRTAPGRTLVDGAEAAWPLAVWSLWRQRNAPKFRPGERCVSANWSRRVGAPGSTPRGPCFVYTVAREGRVSMDVCYDNVPEDVARQAGALVAGGGA